MEILLKLKIGKLFILPHPDDKIHCIVCSQFLQSSYWIMNQAVWRVTFKTAVFPKFILKILIIIHKNKVMMVEKF